MSSIINITPENITRYGMFCLKNVKNPGFSAKQKWFSEQYKSGLRFKMALNENNDIAAFIEYIPSEYAWRPIKAKNYFFIHCMMTYPKKNQGKGFASLLLNDCETDVKKGEKSGIAVISSKGSWLAGKELFVKSGFKILDSKGRFDLLVTKLNPNSPDPEFIDWEKSALNYSGWNLIYADQCPYHKKASDDLIKTAKKFGIKLNVIILKNSEDAQNAPTGTGVFGLICDGKILADHYISSTRFKNILTKELKNKNT